FLAVRVLHVSFPISVDGRPRLFRFALTAIVVLHSAAIYTIARSAPVRSATLADVEVGSLFAALLLGVALLAHLPHGATLRDTLSQIRRDLVLQEATLDEVGHRTTVALQGAWLSDAVHDEMQTLLGHIARVRQVHMLSLQLIAEF